MNLKRTSQGNFARFAEPVGEAKNCRELSEPRAGGASASGKFTAERVEISIIPALYLVLQFRA